MSAPAAAGASSQDSGDAESGFRLLRDGAKRRRVVYGDVREHLAVDFNTGLGEAVDDAAVAQPVNTGGSVDTRDPQSAELTLFLPTIAIRVLASLDDRLFGGAIDLAPGVVVALRLAKNLLVTAPGRHATFDSCHELNLALICGAAAVGPADRGRSCPLRWSRRSARGAWSFGACGRGYGDDRTRTS